MPLSQRSDLLVWMDLEMTSVRDPLKDKIIEIATVVTDQDLVVVLEGPSIAIRAEESDFQGIPPEVRALHEKSGALKASLESGVTMREAEDRMLAFLTDHVVPGTAPLCGNSIHVDRMFLRLQMPRLESYLHYRVIDVSTVKGLAARWKPEVYALWRAERGDKAHRAKDDILSSIEELKFYRERFFTG